MKLSKMFGALCAMFGGDKSKEVYGVPSEVGVTRKPQPRISREERRKCKSCKNMIYSECRLHSQARPNDIACNDYVKRKKR